MSNLVKTPRIQKGMQIKMVLVQERDKSGEVIDLNTFGGTSSAPLIKEKTFEAMRIVVRKEKPLPPHKAAGPITVQCLSGSCSFFVEEEPRELVPGSWLYLPAGIMHSLKSTEPAVLLVTRLLERD